MADVEKAKDLWRQVVFHMKAYVHECRPTLHSFVESIDKDMQAALTLPAPEKVTPTDELVDRFAVALKEKLNTAREKYGHDDEAWTANDWAESCQLQFLWHQNKGDPRDVAAYCAFMWHHGWSTPAAIQAAHQPQPEGVTEDEAVKMAWEKISYEDEVPVAIRKTIRALAAAGYIKLKDK
jgi:hypothetical protein